MPCDAMKDYAKKLKKTCVLLMRETEGLREEDVCRKLSPDKWCIKEIVWHLADGEEEVFTVRLGRILKESRPSLPGVDQDKLAAERNYMKREMKEGLEKFCKNRNMSLKIIESARPEDWGRTGLHETLGTMSFEDIVKKMVTHDAVHIDQIRKLKEGAC